MEKKLIYTDIGPISVAVAVYIDKDCLASHIKLINQCDGSFEKGQNVEC